MVKISTKSSWGGKRAGAGRKPDPNSIRARCELHEASRYEWNRLLTIHELAPDLGNRLADVDNHSMTIIKAIRIIRKRLAKKGQVLVANSYDRRIAREQGG
jgi:hypothetical protein